MAVPAIEGRSPRLCVSLRSPRFIDLWSRQPLGAHLARPRSKRRRPVGRGAARREPLIAAALTALPMIVEAGQGLINTVGKDVASLFGASPAGQTGQNVPASANPAPPNLTGAAQ